MQYVSRPSVIEAVQWTGDLDAIDACEEFGGDKVTIVRSEAGVTLELLAGKDGAQEWVPVPHGHWLVNVPGDKSDIWPVDPDYFSAKYLADPNDDSALDLAAFRAHGLLWLINKSVFHPMGYGMAIDDATNTWRMLGDGTEPWHFWNTEITKVAIEAGADPDKLPPYPVNEDQAFENVLDFFNTVTGGSSPTKG